MGVVVLRLVFLLKPLLLGQWVLLFQGQFSCSSYCCLGTVFCCSKGSFLVQAMVAWTVGFVVLRAVFLLKPLVPGQLVLLF